MTALITTLSLQPPLIRCIKSHRLSSYPPLPRFSLRIEASRIHSQIWSSDIPESLEIGLQLRPRRPIPGEFPVEAALSGKLLISSSHTPNFAIERGERNRGTTHHPRGQNVVQYLVRLFPCTQGHFLCSSYHEVLGKTSWQASRFGQPHHRRFGSDHSRQSRPSEWRMTAAAARRQKRKENT